MEGRGIVGISLPVKIFEKRSALESVADMWTTGPEYLNRAALERDPIERMKAVIAFMISGLHSVSQ